MEISAPRASRDHAKGDALGAAHLSEWSLSALIHDRLDWYVERAMRIVDSTRLYRAALDFSSVHCVPRHLEGGFGKLLPDDRQNCPHLRDVPSSHPVRHLSERRLRQQIAKGVRLWWPSEKARQPPFFSDLMSLSNTACFEQNMVVEEFDTFVIQWLQTSLDPMRGGQPSEADNEQTDLWFFHVACCNFPRATRLIRVPFGF